MGWQELGLRLIFPYLRGVPFPSKFVALSPQQKADVIEFLLTPDLVGLFGVSRIYPCEFIAFSCIHSVHVGQGQSC